MLLVGFFWFDFDFCKKKKKKKKKGVCDISQLMNCFIYKGFNFEEIVVYDNIFRLHNTLALALLSIFFSVHIYVCFVFNQEMTHFFKNSQY